MRNLFARIRPLWFLIAILLCAAVAITLVKAADGQNGKPVEVKESTSPSPSDMLSQSPSFAPSSSPSSPAVSSPSPAPSSPSPETSSETGAEAGTEGPVFNGYSYTGAVPESAAVDNSWFDDAIFLGDSRTEGFRLHSGLTTSHICAATSLSVFNADEKAVIRLDNGNFGTLFDALAQQPFAKVYIMLGINELGYPVSSYQEGYAAFVDRVKSICPDADIYVQALIPVTASRSATDTVYNNSNIQAFNRVLAEICEEKDCYYVDTYTAFAGADGALSEDLTEDGVHLTASGCQSWLEYLKTHTVSEG